MNGSRRPLRLVVAMATALLCGCSGASTTPSSGRSSLNGSPSTTSARSVVRTANVATVGCSESRTTSASAKPDAPGTKPIRVHYQQLGRGSHVVVLIHGGPGVGMPQMLTDFAPLTKDGLRVVYYDQRGVGRSPSPIDVDYSPDAYVADLEALRVRLGVKCLDLVGHSWGGAVEALYAAVHPDHVHSLVEINGTPLADGPFQQGITNFQTRAKALQARHLVPNPIPDPADTGNCRAELTALAPVYAPDPTHPQAYIPKGPVACSSEASTITNADMSTDDVRVQQLRVALARWSGRALVIQGAEDPFGRPWTVADAAEYAGAQVTTRVIPHAGHIAWLDDPTLVGQIGRFLQSH